MVRSRVFDRLLDFDSDIVGYVAYALHERDRWAYVAEYTERNGSAPTQVQLDEYDYRATTEQSITTLRMYALDMIRSSVMQHMSIELDKAVAEIRAKQKEDLQQVLKESKPSYWIGVGQGILASTIFASLIALAIVLWKYANIPYDSLFNKLNSIGYAKLYLC